MILLQSSQGSADRPRVRDGGVQGGEALTGDGQARVPGAVHHRGQTRSETLREAATLMRH